MTAWTRLSLDAKVVGALAIGNALLLIGDHTVVQVTRDAPLWQLFPGLWGGAWLLACGLLAVAYPLRDHRLGAGFAVRDRVLHLAAIVLVFAVVPTVAAIVLRETGKPYTYVHDGAIMVEEAARKLVAGQDPYVSQYLDTPLFYWPMINNPALYHFTYFPILFLITVPFVFAFDRLHLFFDERYLYLPAYLVTLAVAWLVLPARSSARSAAASSPIVARGSCGGPVIDPAVALVVPHTRRGGRHEPSARSDLALVAIIALDPQLYPFVVEGRNDFFVLLFLFAGIALLQRERRTLGGLAIAIAAASKLHAGLFLPFVAAYLFWRDSALPPRARALSFLRASWAGGILLAVTFLPFLLDNIGAFWDDVVAYNAGGAAWSYPVSGMGFGALLRAVGVISYPQQEFPFAAFQVAAALPLAAWSLRRLGRDPQVVTMLEGYAMTLLAFLFFGRYFHGNHLGFILAVAAPIPFLRPRLVADLLSRIALRPRVAAMPTPGAAVLAPVALTGDHDQPAA